MNERIRELAVQAYELCNKRTYGTVHSQEEFNQKFAELIGRECLALADNIRDDCDADGSKEQALGAAWVGLAIARHFGVEG